MVAAKAREEAKLLGAVPTSKKTVPHPEGNKSQRRTARRQALAGGLLDGLKRTVERAERGDMKSLVQSLARLIGAAEKGVLDSKSRASDSAAPVQASSRAAGGKSTEQSRARGVSSPQQGSIVLWGWRRDQVWGRPCKEGQGEWQR